MKTPCVSVPSIQSGFWPQCRDLAFTALGSCLCLGSALAGGGEWHIEQLSIKNALSPAINNSGEIVWALNLDGGIFSSTRGKLAVRGLTPHLSNDGEVVYADRFDPGGWDLVSTERGRLTFGGVVDVNNGSFDVNAPGEFVYNSKDSNGHDQIFSSIRGQITFDTAINRFPSINDTGEIVWLRETPTGPPQLMSTTRGVLPSRYGYLVRDLNNLGETAFSGSLDAPGGNHTYPHIFDSEHGVIIDDPLLYQWGGSLNDHGVIVWHAPERPGSSTWYVYQAQWVPEASVSPCILAAPILWLVLRKRSRRSAGGA